MRLLARLGVLALIILTPAWALALPPVWTVRSHDCTVVLFGSVHLLPQGLDWRPPALLAALAQADDVWFEAPMDDVGREAATQAAQSHARLPEGQSLWKLLSARGRDRLRRAEPMLHATAQQLDGLEPWYVDLAISNSLYAAVGAQGSQGVEQQLWAQLPAKAVRRQFETPAEQVEFFADAALEDQVASLEQTLRDMSKADKDYHTLLKAWVAGDLRTLDREVVRPLKAVSPKSYDVLVRQRNARWIAELTRRLERPGHVVVIVGMGHLIGPDGLPARLRALGYDVEGPR